MPEVKGRLIKPPSMFIDNVNFDVEELGDSFRGTLELPVGASLTVDETYRVELSDGRAGDIRVTSYNEISTKGEFTGVGTLSR